MKTYKIFRLYESNPHILGRIFIRKSSNSKQYPEIRELGYPYMTTINLKTLEKATVQLNPIDYEFYNQYKEESFSKTEITKFYLLGFLG